MSILRSIENEAVETLIEIDDRATLNSRIDLSRRDGATHVTWSVEAQCADGWINVPCRYMNLVLRGMVQRQLDNGLARLKTLVAVIRAGARERPARPAAQRARSRG